MIFGNNFVPSYFRPRNKARLQVLIGTTGDVYVQTIERRVLNAMNSRTMEILADWKSAILDRKVTPISDATPKRRTVKVETQLDQLGPSTEGRNVVSA